MSVCTSFPVRHGLAVVMAIGMLGSAPSAFAQDATPQAPVASAPQSTDAPAPAIPATPTPDQPTPAPASTPQDTAAPAPAPPPPAAEATPQPADAPAQTAAPSENSAPAATTKAATTAAATTTPASKAKGGKVKVEYTGPTTIIILPPTPMLDGEGKQRVDPDGKLMFNPPVKQIRDKKGHPVFDEAGKPVFQTASNLGYDEKGKRIIAPKVKPPKMTPVSIASGTLTVDGWTGKAALNYDIPDMKFLYIYAPGIGTTIVSLNTFPGAKEQPAAFNDKSLKITVDGHPLEVSSDKRLLGKKSESAWVAVDRDFKLPTKFPVFGYGTSLKPPYAWPGSKQNVALKGPVEAPPLPVELRPTLLLAPCPAGMMRAAGPPVLPGQRAPDQPCIPIKAGPAPVATPAAAPATAPPASTPPPAQVTAQNPSPAPAR